jgi:hypothetical protein
MLIALQTNSYSVLATPESALCPLVFLVLILGFVWAVLLALRDAVAQLKRLHKMPCDRCIYYTGCQFLKCTVHPSTALTEDAVDCLDFASTPYGIPASSNRYKQ